ncbi:MAG: HEAT repeat domain-containing protein [Myxococcales bacterium]|nr:HEAT repeat domain-containing protein [Myxococcales bacterium]
MNWRLLLVVASFWLARPAPARQIAPVKATAQEQQEIATLLSELRSKEGDAVEAAQKLAALEGPQALEAMLTELAIGVQPRVAAALLEGLVPRKDPRAIEVLALYSRNRNPELRHRAVQALGEIHDAQVVPLLVAALSDGSAEVRAAAAAALGARREKSAERPLLRLLQRQDPAAPAALGQIGGPETARTLAEMVGNIPDRLVVQTLGELLKRADFGPDPLRLEVVRTLGKIPGNEALDALTDYLKLSSKDRTRPSRVEASKIIEQRTAK